jgi:hypothetical protein
MYRVLYRSSLRPGLEDVKAWEEKTQKKKLVSYAVQQGEVKVNESRRHTDAGQGKRKQRASKRTQMIQI